MNKEQRQATAHDMRKKGMSYHEIGKHFGIRIEGARQLVVAHDNRLDPPNKLKKRKIMKPDNSKQDKRVAFYTDNATLKRIDEKRQELHKKGLAVSLSQVISMLVVQGLERAK